MHCVGDLLLFLGLRGAAVRCHTVHNWIVKCFGEMGLCVETARAHPARHAVILEEIILNWRPEHERRVIGQLKKSLVVAEKCQMINSLVLTQ